MQPNIGEPAPAVVLHREKMPTDLGLHCETLATFPMVSKGRHPHEEGHRNIRTFSRLIKLPRFGCENKRSVIGFLFPVHAFKTIALLLQIL